jgi:hypothetical protein
MRETTVQTIAIWNRRFHLTDVSCCRIILSALGVTIPWFLFAIALIKSALGGLFLAIGTHMRLSLIVSDAPGALTDKPGRFGLWMVPCGAEFSQIELWPSYSTRV